VFRAAHPQPILPSTHVDTLRVLRLCLTYRRVSMRYGMLGVMTTAALPLLSDELAACCSPPAGQALDAGAAERLAAVLKVLAEPTRLRLLSLVAAHQDSEECICNLTELVGVSQPTVSHHMKLLVDAGLLQREQRGKWAYYRLVAGALDSFTQLLSRVGQPA
jgi:ArsR family transcriptional regulator, arsenate/arsenite/antimonite-responsive transcriptional repressor